MKKACKSQACQFSYACPGAYPAHKQIKDRASYYTQTRMYKTYATEAHQQISQESLAHWSAQNPASCMCKAEYTPSINTAHYLTWQNCDFTRATLWTGAACRSACTGMFALRSAAEVDT